MKRETVEGRTAHLIEFALAKRPSPRGKPEFSSRTKGSKKMSARRRDIAVHVVTDENVWRYVRECTAAELICDLYGPGGGPSQLVVPTLERGPYRWLGGDVMLIAIGTADGEVRGATRLSSMLGPAERYARLRRFMSGEPLQRSPAGYIWDGFDVVAMRHGRDALTSAPAALLAGLQSYALKTDIEQLVAIVDVAWVSQLLELGWNPVPLGLPQEMRGTAAVAVLIDISELALKRTRTVLSVAGPSMIWRGLSRRPGAGTEYPRRYC